MTTFRRIFTLCAALLLAVQLPLAALSITVDTSYGNVTIANEDVTHYTSEISGPVTEAHGGEVVITHGSGSENGTVSVDVNTGSLEITGDVTDGLFAAGDAQVLVDGNVSGGFLYAVKAYNDAEVVVTGDAAGVYAVSTGSVQVDGSVNTEGTGVNARDQSTVTVGGDITAGNYGIEVNRQGHVTVQGDVKAEYNGVFIMSQEKDGRVGQVTVEGSITSESTDGVDVRGDGQITVNGNISAYDMGAVVYDDGQITVNGNITGANAISAMANSQITVNGNITGSSQAGYVGGYSKVTVNGHIKGDVQVEETAEFVNNIPVSAAESAHEASGSLFVLNQDSYIHSIRDGVLKLTVKGDDAVLTLTEGNMKQLTARGIHTVILITDKAETSLKLNELMENPGTYVLYHKAEETTLTRDGEIVK